MAETVCLVSAPVSTDYEDLRDATGIPFKTLSRNPKLGVLTLAAVLERSGVQQSVFDLDRAYATFLRLRCKGGLATFPEWVGKRIARQGVRLFGFSSVCSSYPLTLRVAEAVKRAAPGCTILLGGPQASVVDRETLAAFPYVDFVLRGEADLTLPLFVEAWNGKRSFSTVPGLTFRSPFGPQRTPDPSAVNELDDLPLPAFHLTRDLEDAPFASLELGRGCPYACTFCSTNDFFRRKFRVKSPTRMLADMRAIASRYGIRRFDLVHDMFTVDRRRVVSFCEAMIESGEGFRWACSARTDSVDPPLLELMARAGCESIFFGVEAGSAHIQAVIEKDLDIAQAREIVTVADRNGIETTVSVIAGFPEETEDDLRDTLDMIVHSLRHVKSAPQFHILAPLAGTPIHRRFLDQLTIEELCSDVAYQGCLHNVADRALIVNHPEVFPNFYLLPTPHLDRANLLELREFIIMAAKRLRWLTVALHRQTHILDVFNAWRTRREELCAGLKGWEMRRYYTGLDSRNQFLQFINSRAAMLPDTAIEALTAYYRASMNCEVRQLIRPSEDPIRGAIRLASLPVRTPNTRVIELDWDIQEIIDALKTAEPLTATPRPSSYRTEETPDGIRRLIAITPLIAAAIELCDGSRTVRDFVARMAPRFDLDDGLQRYAAKCLLRSLRDEGLIAIYSPQSVALPAKKKREPQRRRLAVTVAVPTSGGCG